MFITDAEVWKEIDRYMIQNFPNSFEKSTNCTSFVWDIGKLPKKQAGVSKITFDTNVCDEEKTWNLFMNYKPNSPIPFAFILMHFGRSSYLVSPALKLFFSSGKDLIISIESDPPTSFINGDWDMFEYKFKKDLESVPTIEEILLEYDYHLQVEIRITYDVMCYNYMRQLWDYLQDGQYEDLEKALSERKDESDLIITVGDNEFYVERQILSLRSEMFFSMYKHAVFEGIGELKIDDVDSKVVHEMLNFIYTGKIDDIEKYVYDLLELANRFKIKSLSELCEETISMKLSISSLSKVIDVTERYNLVILKECVLKFIAELLTENFKQTINEAVLEEIVYSIYNVF